MDAYHRYEGHISPRPPFAFEQSLAFHQGQPPAAALAGAAALTDAVMLDDRPVAWQLRSPGKVESPLLTYQLLCPAPLSETDVATVLDRIHFYLSLDEDLQPFYTLAWDDEAFAPLLDRLYGYHQVKFITPFAAAVWAILTQRTAWSIARGQRADLIRRFGAQLPIDDAFIPAFPTAAAVAAANLDDLAACCGSARRADYVRAAAAALADTSEMWLRTAPVTAVRDWLLAIDGIGPWSAEVILLRGLGRFAAGTAPPDRRLVTAARRVYGADLTADQVAAAGQRFGPWQGYWAHYLRFAARET